MITIPAMAGPSAEERERVLDLLNEEFNRRIDQQAAAGGAVDTKATLVVGFVVVAVPIFLGLRRSEPWAALALASYLVAFIAGVWAVALRRYNTVPKPSQVVDFYQRSATEGPENLREHILATLVATKVEAVRRNGAQDKSKVQAWWVMVVAFGIAVTLSVVSVLEAENGPQHPGRDRRRADFSVGAEPRTDDAPSRG